MIYINGMTMEKWEKSEWWQEASHFLYQYALKHPTFTSDDYRKEIEAGVGDPPHPKMWGALIHSVLVLPGHVVNVDHELTKVPTSNRRQIRKWRSLLCPAQPGQLTVGKRLDNLNLRVHSGELTYKQGLVEAYEMGAIDCGK